MSSKNFQAEAFKKFVLEEARWLDSVVRKLLPKWLVWLVEKTAHRRFIGVLGRFLHFAVDYVYIGWILGVHIKRNEHKSLLTKGFRGATERLDRITTTVFIRGKEHEKKEFIIGLIIK